MLSCSSLLTSVAMVEPCWRQQLPLTVARTEDKIIILLSCSVDYIPKHCSCPGNAGPWASLRDGDFHLPA